ncbi:MAG: RDD family protein [Fimbriimonadaceae bacterium]
MNDQHLILTPEKAVVTYQHAGLMARAGAHLIDLIVVVGGLWTLLAILSFFMFVAYELFTTLMLLLTSFGIFLYFILFEMLWKGQTIGKRLMRLQVVMVDGTPITPVAAIYRNVLRIADFLPAFYFAGLISFSTTERSQRLGDLAADTVVAYREPVPRLAKRAPHRFGIHPFEHTITPLSRMTLEEYIAIKRLCDRFPYLPPETQQRSIQEIWEPFAQREGIEGLPNVHPVYQMEAVVMKFSRMHKLV